MHKLLAILVCLALTTGAHAQKSIPDLPAATLPLAGTELAPLEQWDGIKWVTKRAPLSSVVTPSLLGIGSVRQTYIPATGLGALANADMVTAPLLATGAAASNLGAGGVTASMLASGAAAANLGFTPLNPANNLSDLASVPSALAHLGIGTPQAGYSAATGLGSAANGNTAANNAALSALPASASPATRLGFLVAGDSPALVYTASGSACTLNSGTGDGGSQVPTSDGKCWVAHFGLAASAASWGVLDTSGSTDYTMQLQSALNYSGTVPVTVPCGTYKTSSVLVAPANAYFSGPVGSGYPNCVDIRSTSATADVIDVNGGQYYIGYITFDKSVTPSAGYAVNVAPNIGGRLDHVLAFNNYFGFSLNNTARAYCDYCSAQQNYSDGFTFHATSGGSLAWIINNGLAQFNNGHGFSTYVYGSTSVSTGQQFLSSGTYENSGGGYIFSGDAGSSINDVQFSGVSYSSYDGGNGYEWDNLGANNIMHGVFAEGAGTSTTGRGSATAASGVGAGIIVQDAGSAQASALTIVGGHVQWNSYQGLAVTGGNIQKLTLVGFHAEDNNWNGAGSYAGIEIDTGYAALSSVTSINNLHTWQPYGLGANTTAQWSKIISVGGQFSGSVLGCQNPPIGSGNTGSGCSGATFKGTATANGQVFSFTQNQNSINIDTYTNSISSFTVGFPSAPNDGTSVSISHNTSASVAVTLTPGSGDVMGCANGATSITSATAVRCKFFAGVGATAPHGGWYAF